MEGTSLQQQQRAMESEALIESSFRRLIASIESEREKIRSSWVDIDQEQQTTTDDLARLKLDTEEWCNAERSKVETEWKRLDRLRERMSVLWPADKKEVLQINCSGTLYNIPKRLLCAIEGSYLNHMFSDAYVQSVPRDEEGRYFLDFNPDCFGIIVDWLEQTEVKRDVAPPKVPDSQKQNMDLLAEALNLKPFMRLNSISTDHKTSLKVSGNIIQATHQGWQVVSAREPIKMTGSSYIEVRILHNPDPTTDRLAIGLCGHVPTGVEAHSIRIKDAVMYNSNVGLIGDAFDVNTCEDKYQLEEGSTLGIKHDMRTRMLHFWYQKKCIASCTLKKESLERMRVLYPIFALHVPEQKIEVDFSLSGPMGSRKTDPAAAAAEAALGSALEGSSWAGGSSYAGSST